MSDNDTPVLPVGYQKYHNPCVHELRVSWEGSESSMYCCKPDCKYRVKISTLLKNRKIKSQSDNN